MGVTCALATEPTRSSSGGASSFHRRRRSLDRNHARCDVARAHLAVSFHRAKAGAAESHRRRSSRTAPAASAPPRVMPSRERCSTALSRRQRVAGRAGGSPSPELERAALEHDSLSGAGRPDGTLRGPGEAKSPRTRMTEVLPNCLSCWARDRHAFTPRQAPGRGRHLIGDLLAAGRPGPDGDEGGSGDAPVPPSLLPAPGPALSHHLLPSASSAGRSG